MDSISHLVSAVHAKPRKQRQLFTPGEDCALCQLVHRFGESNWRTVADQMRGRSPRQCRDRWREYLSPELTKAEWGAEEDATLIAEYEKYGPRWAVIASTLRGRSEVTIKNRWKLLQRRNQAAMSSPRKEPPLMEEPKTNDHRARLPVPPEMIQTAPHDLDEFIRSVPNPVTIQMQYIAKRDP
jgi:hypothetical protein